MQPSLISPDTATVSGPCSKERLLTRLAHLSKRVIAWLIFLSLPGRGDKSLAFESFTVPNKARDHCCRQENA